MSDTDRPCIFVPAHEPWTCSVHPTGFRTSLDETICRAALSASPQPLSPAEIEEFDHWAESRRGRGVSLGMLWALRLRATLAAGVTLDPRPAHEFVMGVMLDGEVRCAVCNETHMRPVGMARPAPDAALAANGPAWEYTKANHGRDALAIAEAWRAGYRAALEAERA